MEAWQEEPRAAAPRAYPARVAPPAVAATAFALRAGALDVEQLGTFLWQGKAGRQAQEQGQLMALVLEVRRIQREGAPAPQPP